MERWEQWSLAANLWERHELSEKLNGAKSAKGEVDEEEGCPIGSVRSAAAACGRRPFRLTRSRQSEFLKKQRWRR